MTSLFGKWNEDFSTPVRIFSANLTLDPMSNYESRLKILRPHYEKFETALVHNSSITVTFV